MVSLAEIRWEHGSWWWVLLVLPMVLGILHVWAWRFRRRVTQSFSARRLVPAMVEGHSPGRRVAVALLVVLGLELLVLSALRPRYGLKEVTITGAGVDVAVVLDVSRSMKVADIAPDRLTAAIVEISHILDGMSGNRVALVPFAGLAFVQTPLTLDYEAVKQYLASLKVTDIPVQGTVIGRALRVAAGALGLDREVASGSTRKVIFLFTDGENHEGEPEKVSEELAERGVRIYTVGVGTPAGEPLPVLDDQDRVTGTARDKDGVTPILSKLNEDLLKSIAAKTGGRYFSLTSVGSVAEDLLKEVAAIEKSEYEARMEKLLEDRFQYPLAAGVAFLVAAFLLLGGGVGRAGAVAAGVLILLVCVPVRAQGVFEKAHGGVKEALRMLGAGQAGDAAKALSDLVAEMPNRPDLLYNLALARHAAGEHEEAVKVLDQALSALVHAREPRAYWPSRARILHAKGTILAHQARRMEGENRAPREVRNVWRQAVEALAEALVLDPDALNTQRNLELAAMAAYPPCSKTDDTREPNESAAQAPFLTPDPNNLTVHEELMLCPNNEDWFRLPLRPEETLFVRVLEPAAEGGPTPGGASGQAVEKPAAVDLTLQDKGERDLAPTGKLARLVAREAMEVFLKISRPFGVGPGGGGGDTSSDDGVPYTLDARIVPPCPAGDDGAEENDSREAARPVEDGEHAFRICPGDDDWFRYIEKQGTQKEIALEVPGGEGPLEMEVFLADGALVDVVRQGLADGGVALVARLPKAEQEAPFLIRVFGGGGQGFYSLAIRDPKGGQDPQKKDEAQQPQGSQAIREQLEAIDRNEENLEAQEAARRFPAREYVPEKDW